MVAVEAPPVVQAVRIGPVGKPERTIGWDVLTWASDFLLQPDGPKAGEPWRFTREQVNFVLNWYALDADGRFVYRSGVYRRMKGAGKTPFGAALCAVEFVGPCRPRTIDGETFAVSHPAAWVQVAAVSRDQTRNMMTLFPAMLSPRAIDEYGVDLGKEIIYAGQGRRRIEAVTSSPRALEGARSTFVVSDETHHWLANNEGHDMAEVIARNLAKSRDGSARALATTNAHAPGEDSIAERDFDAWQLIDAGKTKATGYLYDSLEAPPETELPDRDSLRAGIEAARGDSEWLDVDRLIEEIYDPRTPASVSRRFYLNQIHAAEDAYLSPQDFDLLADPWWPVAGRMITLGLDGSESDDHTALNGCDVETGHLFTLHIWDPEQYGGEIPRLEVDGLVAQCFARWDVVGFYSDVHPFETYIDKWSVEYGEGLCVKATQTHPIAWDMRGRQQATTKTSEAMLDAIVESVRLFQDGTPLEDLPLTHDADAVTNGLARQHAHNARNRINNFGSTFGKEHRMSSRKVDWLAAAMLARQCRQDYLVLPENKKRKADIGLQIFF